MVERIVGIDFVDRIKGVIRVDAIDRIRRIAGIDAVLEDRERTLDSALDKMLLSLTGFASEMERERAKQRTYDAMLRKAKAGHVTGGKVYGYDNHEVLSAEGHRLHVLRVVNPREAELVRQIFDMYAGGLGITRIAKRLNAEGVPAPRQSPRGWAPTAVREILYRPLYKGEIVWNQHQKIVLGGTKKRRPRDEKDWVRLDAPDLRIITPDLWTSVYARLAKTKGKGKGQSAFRDQDSKYLLTGMARCAHCGGPMTIVGQDYHRRKGRFYGCSYYKNSWLFDLQKFTAGRARVPRSDRAQVAP